MKLLNNSNTHYIYRAGGKIPGCTWRCTAPFWPTSCVKEGIFGSSAESTSISASTVQNLQTLGLNMTSIYYINTLFNGCTAHSSPKDLERNQNRTKYRTCCSSQFGKLLCPFAHDEKKVCVFNLFYISVTVTWNTKSSLSQVPLPASASVQPFSSKASHGLLKLTSYFANTLFLC